MGSSEEECIGTLSVIVEALDQDGRLVQSISSARDVVEDVGESPNFLGSLRSCSLLGKRLQRLRRSTAHPSLFSLPANLKFFLRWDKSAEN